MSARLALAAWVLATAAQSALAATLALSVESEAIHANMPFTLSLSAKGFEEEPPPAPPDLAIEGCEVTYLGVSPNVSSSIQIINRQRSEWREVTFVYRWQVLAPAAGRYTIPPLRVEQAGVEANSPATSFDATEVPSTEQMVVRMALPDRPLWVGETFDASVEWLLARDVRNYEFSVPLFNLEGADVAPVPGGPGARTVAFSAGARQVELPLSQSTFLDEGDGRSYERFSFDARVTLNRAGTLDLPPVRVVAQLRSGTGRDSWGFRRATYDLFRAEGAPRRLTVRPLPVAGRPPTFVNAIGSGYALDVQASRTVVSVGEPVELTVRLRGDGPLVGLSLPPLGGPGGLPTTHFTVPEGSVAGEVDEESNSKRFTFTVRVKSAEVREIPPLAFSFFDPAVGDYRTVTSEPVALSVGTAQLVGVADVVAAPAVASQAARDDRPDLGGAIATLVGADMSLSAPEATLGRPWGTDDSRLLLGTLYGAPLIAALVAFWAARNSGRRMRSRTIRRALRALEKALDAGQPARQAAPVIIAAMRRLAQASGNDPRETSGMLERLETHAFDPNAAEEAVSGEIAAALRQIARQWSRRPGVQTSMAKSPAATGALALLVILIVSPDFVAAESSPTAVEHARSIYGSAIEETDRLRRVRLFESAERAFRPLAAANADSPELQVDWGNAALGAQDAGRAVLAYRRALEAAPDNERARANLAWLRDRLPVWLSRPAGDGALDSLLFWRDRFAIAQLHLIGALAFGAGVLLAAPWPRRPRWLGAIAVPAFVVWGLATGSALLSGNANDEAVVVVDGIALRSADSPGASPTFANPLPAGTEIVVVETRDAWVRVALADGTRGWLTASAVERVVQRLEG